MTPSNLADLGDRIWLVLGGGGLKGMAHVGAWRALGEMGITPSGIVGTSIGSLIGCCLSGGATWRELEATASSLKKTDIIRVNRRVVWVNGIKQPSVFRGDTLREYFERILPVREWAELTIPVQVNAVSLGRGESVWFGPGGRTDASILDAVHASSSLPVLYPPVAIADDYFVDGGTLDMLGLDRAAELGATGIIAIDTGAGGDEDPQVVVDQGMVGVHQRIFGIMTGRRRREKLASWDRLPLRVVRPQLDGFGTFDFSRIPYFLEEGYRTVQALR